MTTRDRLGELEQLILLAVLRLGDDAYGAALQEELKDRAGRGVSIGTIYVTLKRLEKKGLVSSDLGEPTEVRGGKAKRIFRLEPDGRTALRRARERLLRMWSGLEREVEKEHPA
jgi:PadR family transcriptional regulator PadR